MSLGQLAPPTPAVPLDAGLARRDVALLRWPAQEDVRERMEVEGRPRLLLISSECLAPVCADELEDWVREPLEPVEIEARAMTLRRRAQLRALRPRIDESGIVRVGAQWVDLPEVQVPIARLLISRFGRLVLTEEIQAEYLSAGGSTNPRAVKAMIGRVKHKLATVDLRLANVRDRGYMLDAVERSAPLRAGAQHSVPLVPRAV